MKDNAIFRTQTAHIPDNVASAALAAGLPSSSVKQFVTYITSHDNTGISIIPGVNDKIVAAGTKALLETYVQAFRYVWLSAIPFLAVAAIGECASGY